MQSNGMCSMFTCNYDVCRHLVCTRWKAGRSSQKSLSTGIRTSVRRVISNDRLARPCEAPYEVHAMNYEVTLTERKNCRLSLHFQVPSKKPSPSVEGPNVRTNETVDQNGPSDSSLIDQIELMLLAEYRQARCHFSRHQVWGFVQMAVQMVVPMAFQIAVPMASPFAA